MTTLVPPRVSVLAVAFTALVGTATIGAFLVAPRVFAQDAGRGEAIFANNCAVCHGANASGRLGPPLNMFPPQVASLPPAAVAGQLTGIIRSGIPGAMPAFLPAQISDEEVPHLVAYLFSVNGMVPSPTLYEALEPVDNDPTTGRMWFPETGHSVGGEFRGFFILHGGVPIFGLPLTEEYWGVSPESGETLRMQLFERARMELHPDAPLGERIKLSLLGAEDLRVRIHFAEEDD